MQTTKTPPSHSTFSWVPTVRRVPMGHTQFSWGVGPREKLRRLGYGLSHSDAFGGKLRRRSPYGGVLQDDGFEWAGQQHYDALAEAVLEYAETTLVTIGGLVKIELLPGCPVYHSEDFFTNDRDLLILIQGTGRVRVGVWGCALCINDSMRHGSMVEYVLRAKEQGFAVLVLNPNCKTECEGSRSKEEHCLTAWDRLVDDGTEPKDPSLDPPSQEVGSGSSRKVSPARRICVVGHSYGEYNGK
jgi:hypothetical protein